MGRAPCCDKTKVKRGPWSPEEDTILKNYIQQNGTGGNWISLPHKAGLNRCGKSCRLRWLNYLRPDIRHGNFTADEDYVICSLYTTIGSRWSVIASNLPGRTDNDVKNYWNTKLKKKLFLSSSSNTTSDSSSSFENTHHNIFASTSVESNLSQIELKSHVFDHKNPNFSINFSGTPLDMNQHNYNYYESDATNLGQIGRVGKCTNNCSGSSTSVSQISSNSAAGSSSSSMQGGGTVLSTDEIRDNYNGISGTTTCLDDDDNNGQQKTVLNEGSVDGFWMELFLSSSLSSADHYFYDI